jgi:hypothetical protein
VPRKHPTGAVAGESASSGHAWIASMPEFSNQRPWVALSLHGEGAERGTVDSEVAVCFGAARGLHAPTLGATRYLNRGTVTLGVFSERADVPSFEPRDWSSTSLPRTAARRDRSDSPARAFPCRGD